MSSLNNSINSIDESNYTKVVITNSSGYNPSDLSIRAYSYSLPVNLKETCFGLIITGIKKDVDFICNKLQELDKNYIFIKSRGFPAGDKRRCRAHRNGGSRPGFYTLYKEILNLPNISKALDNYEKIKNKYEEKDVFYNKIKANKLKEIINNLNE